MDLQVRRAGRPEGLHDTGLKTLYTSQKGPDRSPVAAVARLDRADYDHRAQGIGVFMSVWISVAVSARL